jgi:hypothetical protein
MRVGSVALVVEMLLPSGISTSSIFEWSLLRCWGKISFYVYLLHRFVVFSDIYGDEGGEQCHTNSHAFVLEKGMTYSSHCTRRAATDSALGSLRTRMPPTNQRQHFPTRRLKTRILFCRRAASSSCNCGRAGRSATQVRRRPKGCVPKVPAVEG